MKDETDVEVRLIEDATLTRHGRGLVAFALFERSMGLPPTLAELAAAAGLATSGQAATLRDDLIGWGYLEHHPRLKAGASRAARMAPVGWEADQEIAASLASGAIESCDLVQSILRKPWEASA